MTSAGPRTAQTSPEAGLFKFPTHRLLPGLARDPVEALAGIGRTSANQVVQVGVRPLRVYFVIHPDHVQHVLRDNVSNYVREGGLWRTVRRLQGVDGLTSEGPGWENSRRLFQPLFSARHVASLIDLMGEAIAETVDELAPQAAAGTAVDCGEVTTRMACRALIRALFGSRISIKDADRLADAIETAFAAMTARMILPAVPGAVPLPGDRTFRRAVKVVDDIVFPVIRESRRDNRDTKDVVSVLINGRGADGQALDDQHIRDDVVAMCVGGTETTGVVVSWLWILLERHPEVAERLRREVADVVGDEQPTAGHLSGLRYTRMAINEVLRLYPAGMAFPRTAVVADTIGGARIPTGATVVLSPYLTHRNDEFWDRPEVFDPERFLPGRDRERHRFAYYPFGGGPHQCLGSHFFTVEAQLMVASLLRRYRPRVGNAAAIKPRAGITLRPGRKVEMLLAPNGR